MPCFNSLAEKPARRSSKAEYPAQNQERGGCLRIFKPCSFLRWVHQHLLKVKVRSRPGTFPHRTHVCEAYSAEKPLFIDNVAVPARIPSDRHQHADHASVFMEGRHWNVGLFEILAQDSMLLALSDNTQTVARDHATAHGLYYPPG